MQKQPRWLRAAIIASVVPQPPMPWHRGDRRQPATFRSQVSLALRQPAQAKD